MPMTWRSWSSTPNQSSSGAPLHRLLPGLLVNRSKAAFLARTYPARFTEDVVCLVPAAPAPKFGRAGKHLGVYVGPDADQQALLKRPSGAAAPQTPSLILGGSRPPDPPVRGLPAPKPTAVGSGGGSPPYPQNEAGGLPVRSCRPRSARPAPTTAGASRYRPEIGPIAPRIYVERSSHRVHFSMTQREFWLSSLC